MRADFGGFTLGCFGVTLGSTSSSDKGDDEVTGGVLTAGEVTTGAGEVSTGAGKVTTGVVGGTLTVVEVMVTGELSLTA